jgi:hypothetical protein
MKCWSTLFALPLLAISLSAEQRGATHSKPGVLVTTSTTGPLTAKPAWEWSDEERIRARFDPASIHERSAAHAATHPLSAQSVDNSRSASQYVIDGSRDPALFLPVELLDVLLQGLHSDAAFRAHARVALAQGIRRTGYQEDDFWNKLQRLSEPYRALLSQPNRFTIQYVKRPDGTIGSFPIDIGRCVARSSLLQNARATFGAQKFDQFLYTAVAPEVWRGGGGTHSVDPAQELLFVSKGCRP